MANKMRQKTAYCCKCKKTLEEWQDIYCSDACRLGIEWGEDMASRPYGIRLVEGWNYQN